MPTRPHYRVWLIVVSLILLVLALPVGSFVVWRMKLAYVVNRRLAAIRAAGLPTSGAELNKWYPAVPAAENAALVLTQAFVLMYEYPDSRSNRIANFEVPSRNQPLTDEDRELISGYVRMNAAALAKAREAVTLPKCRYSIDFGLGVEAKDSELPLLNRITRLCAYEGLLALDDGHPAEANAAILALLGIARTLDGEPENAAWLVRRRVLKLAANTLNHLLNVGQPSSEELSQLAGSFDAAEKTNLLARTLIADRAIAIPYFRMTRADLAKYGGQNDSGVTNLPGAAQQLMSLRLTGVFERDLCFYLGAMETNIALAALPPPGNSRVGPYSGEALEEAGRLDYKCSQLFLPGLASAAFIDADSLADVRLARAALAVERFRLARGRLPERLAEVVPQFLSVAPIDPFDGAELRYRRLPKGYIVYSVDRDRRDDGGREKPAGWKQSDKTPYDITFIVER